MEYFSKKYKRRTLSQTEFFERFDRGARVTRVTMATARYLATRKILRKLLRIESHHHDNDNGNISNRTSIDIDLFNRTPAIGSILSHEKGVLFYRGVSPSKIGLIAPY
jgi:hypothetical protein